MGLSSLKAKAINYCNKRQFGGVLEAPPLVPPTWSLFAPQSQIKSGNKLISFVPYDYQLKISELIDRHPITLIFKTRQLGITEMVASKFLHKACLNPAYFAAVISLGQGETSEISSRVREMRATAPNINFETDALTKLKVKGGGKILFRPSTESAGRSLASVSDILFDEAAFIKKIEQIYGNATASQKMVGVDARSIIVSTPNGRSNWFWQYFDSDNGDIDANQIRERIINKELPPLYYWTDKEGRCKIFIHWRAHPIYSLNDDYLEEQKKKYKLTDQLLQREYNFGLDDTDSTVFKLELITRATRGQWAEPIPGKRYVIGVDPATGGADYFVSQVWDITEKPYSLVAQLRERQTVTKSIKQTVDLTIKYRPEVVAVESNAAGAAIAESFINAMPWQRIEPVVTTSSSKRINTDRLVLLHESDSIIYPDDSFLPQEFTHFVQDEKGKREASSGWHDDTVMAAAIGLVFTEEPLSNEFNLGTIRFS